MTLTTTNYKIGTKLCLNSLNDYYLAKEVWWVLTRVEKSWCENLQDQCYIVKNGYQLTNSLVSVKDLEFFVSSMNVNKVTVKIVLRPTAKAWVKPDLIKNSELLLQTTISERPF
jgi:hypothetical protein